MTSFLSRTARFGALVVAAASLVAIGAAPASAQATRTWVSGTGDDANPCSRTAACKTWAGAISKTAAGGIINVLDSGPYGSVTITKSITIDGTGAYASTLASSTNGLTINGDVDVVLRNIDVSASLPCSGLSGVRVLQARSLLLDGVTIAGFRHGVEVLQSNPTPVDYYADISLKDVTLSNNCTAGIKVAPETGSPVRMVVDGAQIGTSNTALVASGAAEVWVKNSNLSLNNLALSIAAPAKVHDACGNTMVGNATDSAFTDSKCPGTATTPTTPTTPPPAPTPVVPAPVPPVAPAPAYCKVPKLTGKGLNAAKSALTGAGCAVGTVKKVRGPRKRKGKVVAQAVPAGVEVRSGTKIALKVGK